MRESWPSFYREILNRRGMKFVSFKKTATSPEVRMETIEKGT